MNNENLSPVRSSERYVILDALRGFALLGIALANFPEFSLYTFLSADAAAALPSSGADSVVRYLQYLFIDGKFYTIFSLLFGIGFSIILTNITRKGGNALSIFFRRMAVLCVIGALHLMFIWSGDILLLYALMGMVLTLFRNQSDSMLLKWALALLFVPVVIDVVCEIAGVNLAKPAIDMQQVFCARYGITDENFAYWLRDSKNYGDVFRFLIQGACVRAQEFIEGNRYFKVLGLFLIGFYIGRRRLYATLDENRQWLKRIVRVGLCAGLPLSLLYAWSAVGHHPLGTAVHSAVYFVSVYPLAFAYMAGICLIYLNHRDAAVFRWLAAPGRTALTNYIMQSVCGMFLFYGIGLGLGAGVTLWQTELIAFGVFCVLLVLSRMWLSRFRFGPLELLWRMLTYGHWRL